MQCFFAMPTSSRFLYQGDESYVHIKTQQPLTHDYTRRPFHSDTPPSMDEDSYLPILDLQQQSLVEQVMQQWGHGATANVTQESTPPSSPPATNCKKTERSSSSHCICPMTFIKLFSVALDPQPHHTQPVTTYNSVPDYPRTVKCKGIMPHRNFLQCVMCNNIIVLNFSSHFLAQATHQYHFQPVASKLVPDHPSATKCKNAIIDWKTYYG